MITITSKHEVHFADQNVCELNVHVPAAMVRSMIIVGSDGSSVSKTWSGERVLLSGLQPGLVYHCYTENSCGEQVGLAEIGLDDRQLNAESPVMETSHALSLSLLNWLQAPAGRKISTYLSTAPGSSVFERLHYLQVVLYGGQTFGNATDVLGFSPESLGDDPEVPFNGDIAIDMPAGSAGGCKCALSIISFVNPRNLDAEPYIGYPGYDYVQSYTNPIGGNYNDLKLNIAPKYYGSNGAHIAYPSWVGTNGYWDYAFQNHGAAKEQTLYGRCEGGINNQGKVRQSTFANHLTSWTTDPMPSADVKLNAFILTLSYICFDPATELPVDCGCPRTYDLRAFYDTKLKTEAGTLTGVFDRYAIAQAEDLAVLVEVDAINGSSSLLQGKGHRLYQRASTNLNPAWVTAGGDLLHGLAQVILSYDSNTMSQVGSLFNGQSANLGASLATMINSGIQLHEASGFSELSDNLINYTAQRTIDPNRSIMFQLASTTAQKVEGEFSWEALSGIYSDGALAIALAGAGVDECCNYRYTKWISDAGWNAPRNEAATRDQLGYWYTNKGPYYNLPNGVLGYPYLNCDLGKFFGPKPAGCSNPIDIQSRRSQQEKEVAGIRITTKDGSIRLDGNDERSSCSYQVCDLTGRVLERGTIVKASGVLYTPAVDTPGSVYVIKVQTPGGLVTQKIIL